METLVIWDAISKITTEEIGLVTPTPGQVRGMEI